MIYTETKMYQIGGAIHDDVNEEDYIRWSARVNLRGLYDITLRFGTSKCNYFCSNNREEAENKIIHEIYEIFSETFWNDHHITLTDFTDMVKKSLTWRKY